MLSSKGLVTCPRNRQDFFDKHGVVQPIPSKRSILGLFGKYRDWSNFGNYRVTIDGLGFECSEAAYMSLKTDVMEEKLKLTTMDGKEAKKYGQTVTLRSDWDSSKVSCMFRVVKAKFEQNPHLAKSLLDSGDLYIEETNWWNDTFWGVCGGKGENHLGRILMVVRDYLRNKEGIQS